MIPGLGRPPGEGKGYPCQYPGLENSMDCTWSTGSQRLSDFQFHFSHIHRSSLIAQLVKNLPAMQETLVQFLGQEDPLEKG